MKTCFELLLFVYFSEGLSNLIFLVGLPQHIKTYDREPRQVLLRIFGNTLTQLDAETPESFITGYTYFYTINITVQWMFLIFFISKLQASRKDIHYFLLACMYED